MSNTIDASKIGNDELCFNCGRRLGEHTVAQPGLYRCPDPPRYFRVKPKCTCRPAEYTEHSISIFAPAADCPIHLMATFLQNMADAKKRAAGEKV